MQPDQTQQIKELNEQLLKLRKDFDSLSQAYNKNNFSAYQDFQKASNFTTALTVPRYTTLPACQTGQICEKDGKLYICSATNTWTVAGTQT